MHSRGEMQISKSSDDRVLMSNVTTLFETILKGPKVVFLLFFIFRICIYAVQDVISPDLFLLLTALLFCLLLMDGSMWPHA